MLNLVTPKCMHYDVSLNRDGATLIKSNTSEHHIDMSLATPPTKKGIYIFTLAACDGSSVSDEVIVKFSYGRDFSSDVACKYSSTQMVCKTIY